MIDAAVEPADDPADANPKVRADVATRFTSETGRAALNKSRQSRWRDYKQAVELQEVMAGIAKDDSVKAGERASSARVWVELYSVRRVMLGLGAPKTVPASNDPALAKPKRRSASHQDAATPDAPKPE